MAEKLKTFDFDPPSEITKPKEKAVYPWEEWLDGDIWQLTEGEDFQTHPLMMERIIRTRATARGAKVQMRHQPKEFNGKGRKNNPFGLIILQRTDVKGPAETAKADKAADAAKAERARVRAEKKAQAEKDAVETLANAGIKTVAKKAAPKNGAVAKATVSKRPAKKPAAVSKRPARKPVGV